MQTAQEVRDIIETKIPPGTIVPEHTEYQHFYRHVPTNQLFASVTTKSSVIDSPHLKKWAAALAVSHIRSCWDTINPDNMEAIFIEATIAHEEKLKEAGHIGTMGHTIVENYLNSWIATGKQPADIRELITRGMDGGADMRLFAIARSAEEFCRKYKVEPIISEFLVCSLLYGFAGTCDSLMFIEIDGVRKLAIVDWKTSNSIDKIEYAMQVAAYRQALIEMTGLIPDILIVVRLDKGSVKFEVRVLRDPEAAFVAFLQASAIYDFTLSSAGKLTQLVTKEHIKLTCPSSEAPKEPTIEYKRIDG